MNQQPVVKRLTGVNALEVDDFVVDTIQPKLTSFTFNLDMYEITLSFDEPIKFPIYTTAITIQSAGDESGTFKTLTGDEDWLRSDDGLVVTIKLDEVDVNAITKDDSLAHDEDHTFLSISDKLVTDMVGVWAEEIAVDNAQPVKEGGYTGDFTNPVLLGFDFNADTRKVTLYWNETMDATSLEMSLVTFSSKDGLVQHPLGGGQLAQGSEDGLVISAFVSVEDMNILKQKGLARSEEETRLF